LPALKPSQHLSIGFMATTDVMVNYKQDMRSELVM